ncbi:hypothetical protein F4805DRAFT_459811 [Annulohypoxylon moriforme]|nr:hypothetical protein F4805DRAFT_459811 [Annulohypoxylon moriforme]
MASKDDSEESHAKNPSDEKQCDKKLGHEKAGIKKVPRKAHRRDTSAMRKEPTDIITDAKLYNIARKMQTLEIKLHKRFLDDLKNKFDAHETKIKAARKKLLKSCQRDLARLQGSVDKLRNVRLKVQRNVAKNEKAYKKAVKGIKSPPSHPTTPMGPKELHDLGLDDLTELIQKEMLKLALENDEVRENCASELIDSKPTEEATPTDGPSTLAPIRKWMTPEQKRRQLRKRYLKTPHNRPSTIERTSRRIEFKKKKLFMLRSTRQRRRRYLKTMVWGKKAMQHAIQWKFYYIHNPLSGQLGYFAIKAWLLTWQPELFDGKVRRKFDDMLDNIGDYTRYLKWDKDDGFLLQG